MSRQRKHKRRVYAKLRTGCLYRWTLESDEMWERFKAWQESFARTAVQGWRLASPVIASMWFHEAHPKATDILKIQVTA